MFDDIDYLLLDSRFGDTGIASYCINVNDDLCVNIVPFLTLLIIFYLFRVFSLFDLDKDLGGVTGGGGYGGGGGGGGLFDIFGGGGGGGGIFGGLGGLTGGLGGLTGTNIR